MSLFLLVHSPSVGPSTWRPVAGQLRKAGHHAVVPSLLAVGDGEPPYWPRVPAAVRDGVAGLDPSQPVVLVVHSNAGLFAPVIARDLGVPVACIIFADASIPPAAGDAEVAESEFVPFLRELAGADGRLPQWTRWWGEEDVAPMLPEPTMREIVTAEQPTLPLAYYLERIPVPDGWVERPCRYLLFSAAYEAQADYARSRGWPVRTVPGEHLHQVVDPAGVSEALLDLAGQIS
ncbi:MAG TPA: alpha/beta hydrolase [Streptosporangiaceae bacterium]|nr:alpha/beta hydrolase [Streptosporangiaceae bacterium]